jgi:hypothetical protein
MPQYCYRTGWRSGKTSSSWFEYRSRNWHSWLRFLWISSVPPVKFWHGTPTGPRPLPCSIGVLVKAIRSTQWNRNTTSSPELCCFKFYDNFCCAFTAICIYLFLYYRNTSIKLNKCLHLYKFVQQMYDPIICTKRCIACRSQQWSSAVL